MERQKVKSSNIAEVGYEHGTLQVKFNNGGVFNYEGVEPKQYAAMMEADSIGKFLHSNIKGKHECEKVEQVKEEHD